MSKKPEFANARFWIMVHGSMVKLTLVPDQVVTVQEYHPTDEGWYSRYEQYAHCGNNVVRETVVHSRDCDGRMDHEHVDECPLEDLKLNEMYPVPENHDGIDGVPDWRIVKHRQRDHSAEAAGY